MHRSSLNASRPAHDGLIRTERAGRRFTKDFIEASKCYADALQHDEADVPELVGLFATIGRMRVLSSRKVLAIAEELGRKILDIYRQPNKSFSELLEMANDESFDLLREFTEACREEFETMRAEEF